MRRERHERERGDETRRKAVWRKVADRDRKTGGTCGRVRLVFREKSREENFIPEANTVKSARLGKHGKKILSSFEQVASS